MWTTRRPGALALLFVPMIVFSISSMTSAGAGERRFKVRDSVEMAQFTEQAIFSPDGRYFVTLTQRGLLPRGLSEATLWLFDTSTARHRIDVGSSSPTIAPIALARLAAAANGGGVLGEGIILRPTWEADSKSLLFLGRDGLENRQLFRVRLSDRSVTALSQRTQDVVDYGSAGSSVVYFAGPDIPAEKLWWSNDPSAPDIVAGTGQSFIDLLYPNYRKNGRDMPTEFEVWRVQGTEARPVIDENTGQPMRVLGSYNVSALSLSPDGARMVGITNADRIPKLWERYDVPSGLDNHPFRADSPATDREADYSRALQYQEFDLEKGARRPLLAAPLADYQRAGIDQLQSAWSPDERYVAVSGTYIPLDEGGGAHQFTGQCAVAVVDRQSGGVECLIDRSVSKAAPVQGITWAPPGQRLLVSFGATVLEFKRLGAHWKLTHPHLSAPALPLELTIRQDLDEPPVLFGKARRGGPEQKLFDPNPQLAGLSLGTVTPYIWTDARGRSLHGGLAKPPDFGPGHRYPLVIQTHGFPFHQFFRVGYDSETANAGRALAGRGMLVLQVAEPHDEFDGTWREGTEDGTEVYAAAIDQLTREGLVDPTKVGITGYSRSGFYVAKAITDKPERFAAAVIANADPGSLIGYDTYIDYAMPTYAKNAAVAFAGELPYGDGLQKWLERAPGFRTDRIRAPVLISAADPQHLISLWGIYAPLRDQGKPVELQYFRSGQHNLTKPLQIFAHQEMLVDWFDFWLNGHEDPDPAKSAQYARWRKLKELPESRSNTVQESAH